MSEMNGDPVSRLCNECATDNDVDLGCWVLAPSGGIDTLVVYLTAWHTAD